MFTSISIENFRCFDELSVEPLGRVNLVAGTNNVGKTALLEAIFLLIGTTDVALVIKIAEARGFGGLKKDPALIRDLLWRPLFLRLDLKAEIVISGSLSDGDRHRVELKIIPRRQSHVALADGSPKLIELSPDGFDDPSFLQLWYTNPSGKTQTTVMFIDEQGIRIGAPDTQSAQPSHSLFPGFFLGARYGASPEEDAIRFGRLQSAKESYKLLVPLRIVEPRLDELMVIYGGGAPMIHGDIGLDRMLPLSLMGDGLGRLTSLLLTIANAPHGVVLIDEIENGLHHSLMGKVWQAIGAAARQFDTQVFATTHSYECIRAAHEASETSGSYDFRLHRLERAGDTIRAVTYDQEALVAATKAELEVR